jgi:hypothetical protein
VVAAAVIGSAVVGGIASSSSAHSASRAQQRSSDAATNEQARQFDITQAAQAPYQQVGSAALNQLAALYGLPQYSGANSEPLSYADWAAQNGGGAIGPGASVGPNGPFGITNSGVFTGGPANSWDQYQQYVQGFKPSTTQASAPNYDNFFASPDYQFALRQGQQTVQNSAAAQGGLYSGNALRALTDYGQGMASQQLNTYANRLAGIAGVGQTAATNVGNAAMTTGANVGNLLVNQGNARASGIINQGNAWANAANQIGQYYGYGGFGGSGLDAGWGSGANANNAWAQAYRGP